MTPDTTARWVPVLQHVLRGHGGALTDEAAREVVARLERAPDAPGGPLVELGAALQGQGITLDGEALAGVAWALLGVAAPRGVRLSAATRSRLTHLTELHDVSLPSRAREVGGRFAREAGFASDLRRVRPWLGGVEDARGLLAAIFETEWSGFLALLGEVGPWVYAPSVRDLQTLSHGYAALVGAASGAGDEVVLNAALRLHLRHPEGSLLTRLETTDYRTPGMAGRSRSTPATVDTAQLAALEAAFWEAALRQAQARREDWAARRRP